MPARSQPEAFDLVVVALSARALAASARRAGLKVLAIDLFTDADTQEHAARAVQARPSRRGPGFERRALLATLGRHAPAATPVVLGAGFEHAPSLMRTIGARNPIRGASPEIVARLKNPWRFAALLEELDIAHPEHGAGAADRDLLSKRIGASGGAHIRVGGAVGGRRYLQRRVFGRTVSALFLADGISVRVVGFSEQWTDATPKSPFRYGGAVGPISLDPALAETIESALARIVAATGLVGIASADFVLPETDGPAFWLIEINPRPGATLDVFDAAPLPALVGLHLDACEGRLPERLPAPDRARAAAIVYAPRPVSPKTLRRPLWTADWPSCDGSLPAGAPVCTVLADAASPSEARALAAFRRDTLLMSIRAAAPAPTNAMVPA